MMSCGARKKQVNKEEIKEEVIIKDSVVKNYLTTENSQLEEISNISTDLTSFRIEPKSELDTITTFNFNYNGRVISGTTTGRVVIEDKKEVSNIKTKQKDSIVTKHAFEQVLNTQKSTQIKSVEKNTERKETNKFLWFFIFLLILFLITFLWALKQGLKNKYL